ncbi:G-type lectin S-receptor-like serine/threonine-protein kinase SD2-5 [Acorus calamus]|uniref:G-type lectin S-receptor-like serine/threonine-protein kinase SD2-5 n=1 Tax=Acorus calamus TaxID=4465 RepID=A0AAV9C6V4_ACOCL|nr:G-type lectin S-receptor-like serine/threonine-protein kinase SD2-5 [Acorus calamus]
MGPYHYCLLLCFVPLSLSKPQLSVGDHVTVVVPPAYETGFRGEATFIDHGGLAPDFKAVVVVEAERGKYSCSFAVLFGEVKVWKSNHLSQFFVDRTCELELTGGGDLRLKDSEDRIGWSSGTAGRGVERLQLLKTGNLVLMDKESNIKWQTFDHPTDTMLWGQNLHASAKLSSFDENSTVFYTFEIQHNKLALYLNHNRRKYSYWEMKISRDRNISYARLGSTGLKIFDRTSKKMAQILIKHDEKARFLALGKTGNLVMYHYESQEGKFMDSFRAINGFCDLPLPCGQFGMCTLSEACSRMRFSRHGTAVEMVEVGGVSTVLMGGSVKKLSKEECADSCVEDSSCVSVLYVDGDGFGKECFSYGLVGGVKQVERESGFHFFVKVSGGEGKKMGLKKRKRREGLATEIA